MKKEKRHYSLIYCWILLSILTSLIQRIATVTWVFKVMFQLQNITKNYNWLLRHPFSKQTGALTEQQQEQQMKNLKLWPSLFVSFISIGDPIEGRERNYKEQNQKESLSSKYRDQPLRVGKKKHKTIPYLQTSTKLSLKRNHPAYSRLHKFLFILFVLVLTKQDNIRFKNRLNLS